MASLLASLTSALGLPALDAALIPAPYFGRTLRIAVTGLARAGKTAFLTSAAANLLARTWPGLEATGWRFAGAQPVADGLPRFGLAAMRAALASDPPAWPARTGAVSALCIAAEVPWPIASAILPAWPLSLEFLDYPGEWLVDLPMLDQTFGAWSAETFARLARPEAAAIAAPFLRFAHALPATAPAEDSLAREGLALFTGTLHRLRDEAKLSFLQPGRLLMPAPGPPPPSATLFPLPGASPLARLLAERFEAYKAMVRAELDAPSFGRVDRVIVLADVLSALAAGPAALADMQAALVAVAGGLRGRWYSGAPRIVVAATKADHVAARQRGNLARLTGSLLAPLGPVSAHAIAAVRATEDFVWTLDGRPVSAVRGRVSGAGVMTRSYPGEVPDSVPDAAFWAHPFLALPDFEPARLPDGGRGGVPSIGMDALLSDVLFGPAG